MTLLAGTRLGLYEIVAPLGSGGMGEVYRARDTKLRREVALKVLPDTFAADPERLARFTREAHVLATLNHPNIAAIYGVEDSGAVHALVLELVEGPTLADRIAAGPIPIAEAAKIAGQITEALEAAHEKGIVHRDLKPANIKVTPDDRVKVLDFGLAKALADEPAAGVSMPPTMTAMASRLGVIVGTAAYMSPEQAQGKPVDKRTDIWAFGCVLFEMLTRRRAFDGETITDVVVSVMTKEPDWSALSAATPSRIVELLRRCLKKEPRERLRDIGDARIELERVDASDRTEGAPSKPLRRMDALPWVVAAALFAALAVTLAILFFRQTPLEPQLTKLQLLPPEKSSFGAIEISPDGRRVAFTAADSSGKTQLWVRALDSLAAQPLPDTSGASLPFWSPDSRFVGFFADHKLKKIDVSGGSPQTICDLINDRGGARGGTWNRQGVILFAAEPFGPEPIYQVLAAGGDPKPVATLEPSGQVNHHHWPSFLPDGRHFLYFTAANAKPERTGIYLASLDSNEARLLIKAETSAAYAMRPTGAPPGTDYVLFVRERTLMAQPFDRQHLETAGDATPIAEPVGVISSVGAAYSNFSASSNGALVYGAGTGGAQLIWLDRAGKQFGSLGSPGAYLDFRISPDGKRVAVQREDGRGGADLWLLDSARGTALRFTSNPGYHAAPVWSPDGSRIAFFSVRDRWELWEKASNGGGDEKLLLKTNTDLVTQDWSPDGRFFLYGNFDLNNRKGDLSMLSMGGATGEQTKSTPFVNTMFDENFARFSPDGKWIVYVSDDSGRDEVYVRPVAPDGSAGGGKWQVSTNGGTEPRWPRAGKEIFYIGPDNMLMAVEARTGAAFEAGVPRALFPARPSGVLRYDVTSDGQRFLVAVPTEEAISAPATVVLNWFEELKRRVPGK